MIERMKRVWQPRSEIRAKTAKTWVLGSSLSPSRSSAAILVSGRSDRARSSIFVHILFVNEKICEGQAWDLNWGQSIRENCFVHRFEFASEVSRTVYDIFYLSLYRSRSSMCRMEEKKYCKVSTYGCISVWSF